MPPPGSIVPLSVAFSTWRRLVWPIVQPLHHSETPRKHSYPFPPRRWQVLIKHIEGGVFFLCHSIYLSLREKSKCPLSPWVFHEMERALQISSTEPSDFIHNLTRELRAVLYLSLIPRQHVAVIKGVTYSFLTNEYTERSRKESWQSPWQMIPVTGNWDPATLTVGELFPLCQHTAHRAEVILPFYDLLYLASVLALETVYFGDQLYIPRLPFSSALRSVKYSSVYYHFIWLQFFPLTVVQGSLDSESLPLSNSICLNVKKKKKKVELFTIPAIWHFWGNIW